MHHDINLRFRDNGLREVLVKERPPVVAREQFRRHAGELSRLPMTEVFRAIHERNLWGASESVSGLGSETAATAQLRAALPELLRDLGASVLLDLPCGDFSWLSLAPLPVERYIGADIVEEIVKNNRERYGREFLHLDLCFSPLPRADVVLCRDCLVHLSFAQIREAVSNLRRSGSTWLLTTTFYECEENLDIATGDWRMLNFELPPFCWQPPERLLVEGCTEAGGGYGDKSLGLWRISELPQWRPHPALAGELPPGGR
jgi:hypothetical protein